VHRHSQIYNVKYQYQYSSCLFKLYHSLTPLGFIACNQIEYYIERQARDVVIKLATRETSQNIGVIDRPPWPAWAIPGAIGSSDTLIYDSISSGRIS
jgi:hypothetical protein